MCLFNPEKINIEENLTVYKVFLKKGFFHKKLVSNYFNDKFIWKPNQMNSTNLDFPEISYYERIPELIDNNQQNAFLSFKKLKDVKHYIKVWNVKNYEIYECVIPKNSNFLYVGNYWGYDGFASEKLMLIKKII